MQLSVQGETSMTDLRAAAEMSLDVLTAHYQSKDEADVKRAKVIIALRQALAQDEQEPVIDRRLKVKIGRQYGYALNEHWFYLQPADEYAEQALTKHSGISAPPSKPWVSLTDEEFDKCDAHETWRSMRNVAEMLKEKNT